jgi:hypothetical protein
MGLLKNEEVMVEGVKEKWLLLKLLLFKYAY